MYQLKNCICSFLRTLHVLPTKMATEGKDREEIPVFTQFGKRNGHLNRNTRTVFFDAEKSSFTKGTVMWGWCY